MGVGNIEFELTSMFGVGEYMKDLAAKYEMIYKKLIDAGTTMGSAWQAPDNIEYVKKLNSCCDGLQSMANSLGNSGEVLTGQGKVYSMTQKGIIELLGGMPTSG